MKEIEFHHKDCQRPRSERLPCTCPPGSGPWRPLRRGEARLRSQRSERGQVYMTIDIARIPEDRRFAIAAQLLPWAAAASLVVDLQDDAVLLRLREAP